VGWRRPISGVAHKRRSESDVEKVDRHDPAGGLDFDKLAWEPKKM